MREKARGFTLVELLVVVTIIVILISILTPSLERAIGQAQRAKCASNLKGCGQGLAIYLNDSPSRRFPVTVDWWMLLGQLGSPGTYWGDDPNTDNVVNRPLNRYLGYTSNDTQVPVAECPSDAGDLYVGSDNVYRSTGSSYLTAQVTHFGIAPVFGGSPLRAGDIVPPYNKVVLADTPMLPNRPLSDRRHQWHSRSKTERQVNILFADYRVEFFTIDPVYPDDNTSDPSRRYW